MLTAEMLRVNRIKIRDNIPRQELSLILITRSLWDQTFQFELYMKEVLNIVESLNIAHESYNVLSNFLKISTRLKY